MNVRAVLALGLIAQGASFSYAQGSGGGTWAWLNRTVVRRIEINGQRRIGYRDHQVTGDREAFDSLNYFGEGSRRITDSGSVSVAGRNVLGVLNFQFQLSANRFADPQQQTLTITYDRGPIQAAAGDVRGSLLNTNPLASLSRALKGVVVGSNYGRLQTRLVASEARGSARTITVEGNNTSGPYFLQSGRIVSDSLLVQVDGVPQRLLEDYVIDADRGSVNFINKIIAPTSTIIFTYESFGLSGSRGTIRGASAAYDMGQWGRIGLTGMEQLTGGGSSINSRLEAFQGFGAPSTPYFLQFEPIPGSVVIKVDGILQVENVDYRFDADNPLIFFFNRFVPSTQTITAAYRPVATQTVDGDRRVVGIDYRVPVSKRRGFIQYSQATGELRNESNPQKGLARSVEMRYQSEGWTWRSAWRDIPADYVSVETRGFNRNENAIEGSLEYRKGQSSYTGSHQNRVVASRSTSSSGTSTFSKRRVTTTEGGISYLQPDGITWNLRNAYQTSRSTTSSRLNTTSLSGRRNLGRLRIDLGLENQLGRGPISDGTTTEVGDVTLRSLRLGMSYVASSELTFDSRISVSDVEARGKRGTGNDITVASTYRPRLGPWELSAAFASSRSGQLATLGGFGGGFNSGFDGNGFSGGGTGASFSQTGTSNYEVLSLTGTHRVRDGLVFNGRLTQSRTEGNYSSNTKTTSTALGVEWDLGNFNLISFYVDRTSTRFLNLAATQSDTTNFNASLSGAPKGRISYSFSLSSLLSGGSSEYNQDTVNLDGRISYRLKPRQVAGVAFSTGRTTGYYPQNEEYASVFYRYEIIPNRVALESSYKVRSVRNLDSSLTQGAYRSRGFDLELVFDFGR